MPRKERQPKEKGRRDGLLPMWGREPRGRFPRSSRNDNMYTLADQAAIAPGVILIRNDARLPETLIGGTSPFCMQWSFLKDDSDRPMLEKRLAGLGWASSSGAGAIRRAASGRDKQEMIEAALERVLAGASLQGCNCLEIDEIRMHSFLAISYVSVSGYGRQLQARTSPLISQGRAAERGL